MLPGVTVEASSPALIEKVRSVLTDGTGQYRIVDRLCGLDDNTGHPLIPFFVPRFNRLFSNLTEDLEESS